MTPAVRLTGITKTFGESRANDNVSLEIRAGTIHAVVGENGAGKSTLSNIIYGLQRPDSGTIEIDGRPVSVASPAEAIDAGIGMVHQHFMLVPTLTVAENIVLGLEGKRSLMPLPSRRIEAEIHELSRRHGLGVDPKARASSLSVGEAQRVEILKVLYRKSRILILDEPTAVLSPSETERLFKTLRSLVSEGRTVLLITHKLGEVLAAADDISVMQRGRLVGTMPAAGATKEMIARMMVGRDVLLSVENRPHAPGKPVLEVGSLSCTLPDGTKKLDGLQFSVREGEVYGIAGVEGNGQSELLSLLWGMQDRSAATTGSIRFAGREIIGLAPAEIAALGASMIPEDRIGSAIVPEFGIEENLLFGRHREKRFHRGIGFDRDALGEEVARMSRRYDVRGSDGANPPIASLSGGNQQKVVLARELERPGIRLIVLGQPTRGVDIGAIELIHKRIIDARDRGLAILLVSSELEEVIALSTRIGCIFNGAIRREFSEEEVRQGRSRGAGFEAEIGVHIT